jgi:hypothetical protein
MLIGFSVPWLPVSLGMTNVIRNVCNNLHSVHFNVSAGVFFMLLVYLIFQLVQITIHLTNPHLPLAIYRSNTALQLEHETIVYIS